MASLANSTRSRVAQSRAALEARRARDRERLEAAWRALTTPAAADAVLLAALLAQRAAP